MTTTVIGKCGAADLIAVAFYQLGFRPRESLVLVGLHGPRKRVGLVIRADLPPPRHRRAVIESQLGLLRREGCDRLAALVVSDEPPPATAVGPVRLPHRGLVRQLHRVAEGGGWSVVDVLAVGESTWRAYGCHDVTCCPTDGFSLDEVFTGRVATELVAAGYVLASDEEHLVADVDPTLPSAPPEPGIARPTGPDPVDPRDALSRWRELLARPADATAADLGMIAESLPDRWFRDALLITLVPGSGTVPEEVLAGADDAVLDAVFDADPDRELLERGRVLLSAVARTAPPGFRADALALLAWAAWWSGEGARGRLLVQRALADVPSHRLAGLVDQLLLMGVAPDWVVRHRSQR
jgi:hypothetical protein